MAKGCRVIVTSRDSTVPALTFFVAVDDPDRAETLVAAEFDRPGGATFKGETCIGPELDDMSPGEVKLSNELSND